MNECELNKFAAHIDKIYNKTLWNVMWQNALHIIIIIIIIIISTAMACEDLRQSQDILNSTWNEGEHLS